MRNYNYQNKWQKLLTPEIVSLLTQIHEYKGEQTLFIEAKADTLTQLVEIEKKFDIQTNHEPVIMSPVSGAHNGPWLAGYGLFFLRREDEAL